MLLLFVRSSNFVSAMSYFLAFGQLLMTETDDGKLYFGLPSSSFFDVNEPELDKSRTLRTRS